MRPVRPVAVAATLAAVLVTVACSVGGGRLSSGAGPSLPPSAPEARQSSLSYVALGDSFTAAPGLPRTDTTDGCLRSSSNYPALVAQRLEDDYDVELADRSCSAADTTSLSGEQLIGRNPRPPQLDALGRGTDLVTLSIGGNDFGVFLRLVGGCLAIAADDPDGSPCRDAARAEGDVMAEMSAQIEQRLVDAIREVRRRAPRAQVLVVGYPQLVPATGACPERLPIASGDLAFARRVNKALTDNLARAADRTGTTYVDVWTASAGHDVCSEQPWIAGRTGQPGGAIPFHPLPAGQRAVAELVLAEVEP